MIAKTIEIRDRMTLIPALAIRLEPTCEEDRYLLARAGYGTGPEHQAEYVVLMSLTEPNRCEFSPNKWPEQPRTMPQAHKWLCDHFDEIESGAVVDVEFILGERETPKLSERIE